MLLLIIISFAAQARSIDEVRAAYLFQLANFIDLGTSKEQQVQFCFVGEIANPGRILRAQHEKLSKRLNYQVVEIAEEDVSLAVLDCHFIYFTSAQSELLSSLLPENISNKVTVGENLDFLESKGAIALIPQQKKVKIYANKEIVTNSEYKLSSQLLDIAIFYPN